ncbi:MAG: NTP transferase domain-containing protein [Vulcanimicrobiota bacterium]
MFNYYSVILTAGESRRMGKFPKALLKIEESTFIEKIIESQKGIEPAPENILIVLGFHREKIVQLLKEEEGYKFVINPKPDRGMLSSIKEAIQIMDGKVQGFLLSLVDHPLVKEETYNTIIKRAESNPGQIIIPTYRKQKGHPVFFPETVFEELLECPLEMGARKVVWNNQDRVKLVSVNDQGILKDIDTPEIYQEEMKSRQGEVNQKSQ